MIRVRGNAAEWPARFTLNYLARRAGLSPYQMRKWIRDDFPALAVQIRRGRWTYITLQDLQRVANALFEAVDLRGEDMAA